VPTPLLLPRRNLFGVPGARIRRHGIALTENAYQSALIIGWAGRGHNLPKGN